jgi:hypothetical protein
VCVVTFPLVPSYGQHYGHRRPSVPTVHTTVTLKTVGGISAEYHSMNSFMYYEFIDTMNSYTYELIVDGYEFIYGCI